MSYLTEIYVDPTQVYHCALYLGADMKRAMKNTELLEIVAQNYYHALASGEQIHKLPPSAIEYFADMRKSRFKQA
jgi:ribulose-5-phosphate 4-epimerase/fuculose-1-phosphate aldolase